MGTQQDRIDRETRIGRLHTDLSPLDSLKAIHDVMAMQVADLDGQIEEHQQAIHKCMNNRERVIQHMAYYEDAINAVEMSEKSPGDELTEKEAGMLIHQPDYVPVGDEPAPGYPKKWPPEMETK